MTPDGADNVVARVTIPQAPLCDAPDVPAGTVGHIEDRADGYVWVDFGSPYDTVCCFETELR